MDNNAAHNGKNGKKRQKGWILIILLLSLAILLFFWLSYQAKPSLKRLIEGQFAKYGVRSEFRDVNIFGQIALKNIIFGTQNGIKITINQINGRLPLPLLAGQMRLRYLSLSYGDYHISIPEINLNSVSFVDQKQALQAFLARDIKKLLQNLEINNAYIPLINIYDGDNLKPCIIINDTSLYDYSFAKLKNLTIEKIASRSLNKDYRHSVLIPDNKSPSFIDNTLKERFAARSSSWATNHCSFAKELELDYLTISNLNLARLKSLLITSPIAAIHKKAPSSAPERQKSLSAHGFSSESLLEEITISRLSFTPAQASKQNLALNGLQIKSLALNDFADIKAEFSTLASIKKDLKDFKNHYQKIKQAYSPYFADKIPQILLWHNLTPQIIALTNHIRDLSLYLGNINWQTPDYNLRLNNMELSLASPRQINKDQATNTPGRPSWALAQSGALGAQLSSANFKQDEQHSAANIRLHFVLNGGFFHWKEEGALAKESVKIFAYNPLQFSQNLDILFDPGKDNLRVENCQLDIKDALTLQINSEINNASSLVAALNPQFGPYRQAPAALRYLDIFYQEKGVLDHIKQKLVDYGILSSQESEELFTELGTRLAYDQAESDQKLQIISALSQKFVQKNAAFFIKMRSKNEHGTRVEQFFDFFKHQKPEIFSHLTLELQDQ